MYFSKAYTAHTYLKLCKFFGWPKCSERSEIDFGINFSFLNKKCPDFEHIPRFPPGRPPKGIIIKAGVTKIARQANSVRITFNLMRFAICAHSHLNYLQGHFKAFNRISIWTESGWKTWIPLMTFTFVVVAALFRLQQMRRRWRDNLSGDMVIAFKAEAERSIFSMSKRELPSLSYL